MSGRWHRYAGGRASGGVDSQEVDCVQVVDARRSDDHVGEMEQVEHFSGELERVFLLEPEILEQTPVHES